MGIIESAQVLGLRGTACSYLANLDRKVRLAQAASRDEDLICEG